MPHASFVGFSPPAAQAVRCAIAQIHWRRKTGSDPPQPGWYNGRDGSVGYEIYSWLLCCCCLINSRFRARLVSRDDSRLHVRRGGTERFQGSSFRAAPYSQALFEPEKITPQDEFDRSPKS